MNPGYAWEHIYLRNASRHLRAFALLRGALHLLRFSFDHAHLARRGLLQGVAAGNRDASGRPFRHALFWRRHAFDDPSGSLAVAETTIPTGGRRGNHTRSKSR